MLHILCKGKNNYKAVCIKKLTLYSNLYSNTTTRIIWSNVTQKSYNVLVYDGGLWDRRSEVGRWVSISSPFAIIILQFRLFGQLELSSKFGLEANIERRYSYYNIYTVNVYVQTKAIGFSLYFS